MKIGMLFSGQGSQYPGMGSDLYDKFQPAKDIFDLAGSEIKNHCFNGTKETLRLTHVTQPAVFTVSMAAYNSFLDQLAKEIPQAKVSAMAGFSMGEYTALHSSGMIEDFSVTLDLLRKRGLFMTEAGLDKNGQPRGAMAAAFGKRDKVIEAVDGLREGDILECVNFNSPLQTVVAGEINAIERFSDKSRSEYGIKAKKLSVSSAFHSTMMDPASDKLKEVLKDINFSEPTKKVYSNNTGKDIMENKPSDVSIDDWMREKLAQQIKNPVYWQETIDTMNNDGIDIFVEVGPGKTLSALAAKTIKGVKALHVEDGESMEKTLAELKEALNE